MPASIKARVVALIAVGRMPGLDHQYFDLSMQTRLDECSCDDDDDDYTASWCMNRGNEGQGLTSVRR